MKISVVVPVYNAERHVGRTLDSVQAQTFGDWECVCVDDGSTDGSGAILDEYAAKDSRFRVIHQKNGGEGAARNAGMDAAEARGTGIRDHTFKNEFPVCKASGDLRRGPVPEAEGTGHPGA